MSKPVIFFHEEADHTGFLFNSDNCASIQLNPTAVAIYKLIKQGVAAQDIPGRLADLCSAPLPGDAASQIEEFATKLKENNWCD
jgi:hypothetical protein